MSVSWGNGKAFRAKSLLLCAAAVVFSEPVDAQTPPDQGEASLPQDVRADGALQSEIVVTARRREENLQEVPIAITALSDEALREANVQSVNDLRFRVPSLGTNTQGFGNYSPVSIRGQGGYSPGGTNAVAAYINEVPVQSKSDGGDFTGGRYYDLESVQVLKGPQGTLFGRNTTGGAILFQSRRPTHEWGGFIEGTIGNYGRREVKGALNLPLIEDRVRLRVAGQRLSSENYAKMQVVEGGARTFTEDYDVASARATLTLNPIDGLETTTIAEYHRQDGNRHPLVLAAVDPGGFANLIFPGLAASFAEQQRLGKRVLIPDDTDNLNLLKTWSITNITEIGIAKGLLLRNIFGYSHLDFSTQGDSDASRFPIIQRAEQIAPLRKRQITAELQLQGGSIDGAYNWVAGIFFLDDDQPDFERARSLTFGAPNLTQNRSHQSSTALYAQSNYSVTPRLNLTAGLRYTWDRRTLERITATGTPISRGTYEDPSWTLGLDYQFNPDALVYVTSRRGHRSGGLNPAARIETNTTFDSEHLTDLEGGLKLDWSVAGMAARTNLALYHQWHEDVQLTAIVIENVDGTPSPQVLTRNAGSARLHGLEFEGTVNPSKSLELRLGYSYLRQKYTRLAEGVDPRLAEYVPRLLPRHQLNVSARYTAPLPESAGALTFAAAWSYISKTNTSIDYIPDPVDSVPGYGLVNLNIDWNGIFGSPIDAALFVTNLLDRDGLIASMPMYNSVGYSVAVYNEPRQVGIRLRAGF